MGYLDWSTIPSFFQTPKGVVTVGRNDHAAAALYYFAYNFIKIHGTLRMTPAMAAGVTDRLWEVSDLVALLEASERGLGRAA